MSSRIAAALQRNETLDRLALLIAGLEYPYLDTDAYLQRLDEIASRVRLPESASPGDVIGALNQCLFEELGFRGNTDNYYDPLNSFLNDVLERRTGIPITLSVLYIEVARRRGFDFYGVGLPGHFVVRGPGMMGPLVDPFHAGQVLADKFDLEITRPVGNRYIVTRMLANLRLVYHNARLPKKELPVIDVLLELYPRSAEDYRYRGALHHAAGNYSRAIADFERYLQLAADASDADEIRQQVIALKRLLASMN
jgi:regulator of sirC expression with transglutaminase-like and TPR domain